MQTKAFSSSPHQKSFPLTASFVDDKQNCFLREGQLSLPSDPRAIKLSTFLTSVSHRKTNTGLKCYNEVICPGGYWLAQDTPCPNYHPTRTHTHFYAISLTNYSERRAPPGLKIPCVTHFTHKWSPFIMGSSHFSIQNMHQMLLKLTSGDLWIHVVFDTEKQSHCSNAAACGRVSIFLGSRPKCYSSNSRRALAGCTIFWWTNYPDWLQM